MARYRQAIIDYRLRIKEFDYPKGNQNVYTSYQGSGGITLDSIWKRLLFAWTQKDINILFTSYLTPQSKIQIWRSAQEHVVTNRAIFAARQRTLCGCKRRQAILDSGCLYRLGSLSLLTAAGERHGGWGPKSSSETFKNALVSGETLRAIVTHVRPENTEVRVLHVLQSSGPTPLKWTPATLLSWKARKTSSQFGRANCKGVA